MNATPPSNSPQSGRGGLVADWLAGVRLGTPQAHRNIVVWPLFLPGENGTVYRTLDEAVGTGQAQVTEVSRGGSVPELRVINRSPDPLLILDGEELIGAKQNRAVNTTLLLKPRSETVIPVSCTEEGRWHHVSETFRSSEVIMEMKVRRAKMRSVSESLSAGAGHTSDQGQVWEQIQALQAKAAHPSPTGAMHDVFAAREDDLRAALAAFPAQPGQHGLLVAMRGRVAGCDVLSRADTYGRLHDKLVRSYVLDALLDRPGTATPDDAQAREFLAGVATCREERFPSVGCGESVRLRDGATAGAALLHEGVVLHAALFRLDPGEEPATDWERMARPAERRRRFTA